MKDIDTHAILKGLTPDNRAMLDELTRAGRLDVDKLNSGQWLMLEDGAPPICLISAEARAQDWERHKEKERMSKLIITPHLPNPDGVGADLANERGTTSIPVGSDRAAIADKVSRAALRSGKKTAVVVVTHGDGTVHSTWKVSDGFVTEGTDSYPLPTETKETDTMPTKTKTKKAAGDKKPGVIATIIETIGRASGASLDEIVAALKKAFPDRTVKGMTSTAKIQASKHAKRKEKSESRGLVYYGNK